VSSSYAFVWLWHIIICRIPIDFIKSILSILKRPKTKHDVLKRPKKCPFLFLFFFLHILPTFHLKLSNDSLSCTHFYWHLSMFSHTSSIVYQHVKQKLYDLKLSSIDSSHAFSIVYRFIAYQCRVQISRVPVSVYVYDMMYSWLMVAKFDPIQKICLIHSYPN
jgi:hypothetical protein